MSIRANAASLAWTGAGTLLLLSGLLADIRLHGPGPGAALASETGPFGAAAHGLTAAGIGLVVAESALALLVRATATPRLGPRVFWSSGAAAVILLTAALIAAVALAPPVAPLHFASPRLAADQAELEQRVSDGRLTRAEADFIWRQMLGTVHPEGEPVAVTARELASAARLVEDVRRGTARLADVQAAEAEGYQPIPLGSRGSIVHYNNDAYFGRVLDPERSQQAIYQRQPDSQMTLVGVLFLMPFGTPGPAVSGPLTAWHAHDNVCVDPATFRPVGATDAGGDCTPGAMRRTSPEMLHVWLADNPRGVFDSWMQPPELGASAQ